MLVLLANAATVFAQPQARVEEGAVSVTVAEAVKAALTYNTDIVRSKADAEIANVEVSRQSSIFHPVVTISARHRRARLYSTAPGGDKISSSTTSLETGVGGRLPWGGQYLFNVVGDSLTGVTTDPALEPLHQTQLSGRYTQPLLRDAGFTANQGIVERAKQTSIEAAAEYRRLREQLALDVVASYWNLVVRREEVTIREASLAEASSLRDMVERRIKVGNAPRSDLIQADVTVAERQQQVRQAKLTVIDAERDLLALTYLNRTGRFAWANVLVPSETPDTAKFEPKFDDELALALKHRPEVQRHDRALASARLSRDIANNSARPKLDLYAEAGVVGLSGKSAYPAGDPREPPEAVRGGIGKSLSNMVSFGAPFVEVGILFELPLGNADRAGAAEQARLRVKQVEAEDVKTLITLDVRAALQAFAIAQQRLAGARAAAKLAAENVDAQRKRYDGGTNTIFDVLRSQEELARARAETVLAASERETAHARVLAARGTLLEHFGVKP